MIMIVETDLILLLIMIMILETDLIFIIMVQVTLPFNTSHLISQSDYIVIHNHIGNSVYSYTNYKPQSMHW